MKRNALWIGPLALLAALAVLPTAQTAEPADEAVSYDRDVRPILSDRCFKCHGPAAETVAAGLRLDIESEAKKGGRAILAGHPEKSLIISRTEEENAEMRMPPANAGKPRLNKAELDILRRWIEQGAKYEEHWAFVTPKKPSLPSVRNKAWATHPIDAFVLAELEAKKLAPEKPADRATLVRRVALTLTGLPPTPAEAEKFLKDNKPGAYEKMVERYLSSPRYGEHQARFWLDAVRYGDTHGLHLDNERGIFPFRDWVVRAFNDDLPIDKFTEWQLAGDLLPSPTTDQLIATGYIRMNPTTNEGGAIEEEFLAKNTFDRVDTTSTIFLGLTVACARCHDHKFDPISHKDYFQLYAFFNSTTDRPFDGNELLPAPAMRAPNPVEDRELRGMRGQMEKLASAVSLSAADKWVSSARIAPPATGEWQISSPHGAKSFEEAFDTEFGPEPGGKEDPGGWKPLDFKLATGTKVVGRDYAAAYVKGVITSEKARDMEFRVRSDDGVRVWLNGVLIHNNRVQRGLATAEDLVKAHLNAGRNEILFKVVNGAGEEGLAFDLGDVVAKRIDTAFTERKAGKGEAELRKLFLEVGPDSGPSLRYRQLQASIAKMEANIPMTLIAQELPMPRPAYVLKRGEYNLPTDKVERMLPKVFGNLPAGAPKNRLGLARWLTHPKNPLVSRVFVNRIWQQHFGTGLVKTAEDFGNQGDWPSHRQLLDYLAVDFIESGWSLKRLHRQILTSNAFRQASRIPELKREKDPENRLVSRGPRFRLDAEVIRDQALWSAGLLRIQEGGKGFKPYQPDGLWEAIGFLESTTSRYVKDTDDSIYRRSLYLFWKRTSPHPTMLTFDAPMREACTVRRSRTNTPLQALVTMNEPAFLEASRVFAQRLTEMKGTDGQRLDQAFQVSLGRLPKPAERQLLASARSRYLNQFKVDEKAARSLVSIGDQKFPPDLDVAQVASWMLVTNTLMNTDEFLTQH